MPQRLTSFDFLPSTSLKYDYDRYFNGEIWQAFPNEDFTGSPASFAQTMYARARARGHRCRCRVLPDGSVVVQAYAFNTVTPKEGTEAAPETPAAPAAPASSPEAQSA